MEFFVYHRDRAGSETMREQLLETHWSYMDGYATQMIARGPVFDRNDVLTGSPHTAAWPAGCQVISASHTGRRTTLLVRAAAPIRDPAWTVRQASMEDLVLAYMSHADVPGRELEPEAQR